MIKRIFDSGHQGVHIGERGGGSEEFLDRLDAVVDQPERASLRTAQLGADVDPQAVVDGRRDLLRGRGTILRGIADLVGRPDDLPPLDLPPGEEDRPAGGVMVAAPGMLEQSLLGMNFISSLSGFDMRGDRMILRD